MKKKITSILLSFSIIAALLPAAAVRVETNIKIGDYIQMGEYYGEPILWRCVDIDENGPLILSDKIICFFPGRAEHDEGSISEISPVLSGNR